MLRLLTARALQAVPGGGPGGFAEVRRAAVVPHLRGRLLQRHHAHHPRSVPAPVACSDTEHLDD